MADSESQPRSQPPAPPPEDQASTGNAQHTREEQASNRDAQNIREERVEQLLSESFGQWPRMPGSFPEEPEEEEEEPEEPQEPAEQPAPRQRTFKLNELHLDITDYVHDHNLVPVSSLHEDDRTCIICRMPFFDSEFLTTTEHHATIDPSLDEESRKLCVPDKLACGHIVGHKCMRLWVEKVNFRKGRPGTCPVCRAVVRYRPVIDNPSWYMVGLEPAE